jgi:hypothetical protein
MYIEKCVNQNVEVFIRGRMSAQRPVYSLSALQKVPFCYNIISYLSKLKDGVGITPFRRSVFPFDRAEQI